MNEQFYQQFKEKQQQIKNVVGKPLTYAEKILYTHLWNATQKAFVRGDDYVELKPDRVAMQDATAQMAVLQFMLAKKKTTAVPTSVHCDHLIRAQTGAKNDLLVAVDENKEVYDFLQSASKKYGMDFWKPGAGIIHQVFLEEYAYPGGMMVGTDSHSPNAGGLGMVAIGVGGADASDVMAGMPWEVKWPKLIGVKLTGKMQGWTSAKDVILRMAGILTAKGATGCIVEYFGPGAETLSATGKSTICNMGAEIGATTSLFAYDEKMSTYLSLTGREKIAQAADQHKEILRGDQEVYQNPKEYFDQVIEIDLSTLEPRLNGPFTPDKEHPVSTMKDDIKEYEYPENISVALIGSCTNSSYEDIDRCANIAKQAMAKGLKATVPFTITPGSEQIRATMERDGHLKILQDFGGTLLANACGPCIGMWKRMDNPSGERNTIVTSYNRNFAKRNDGNPNTMAFVASPELVTAMAISGKLSFNPITDKLKNAQGEEVKLDPPVGKELPSTFDPGEKGLIAGEADPTAAILVNATSERIALLEPFNAWDKNNLSDMPVLLKAKGKCTTDHISPAGPWLRLRGHIDNISKNMFIGAINAYSDEAGKVKNVLSGKTKDTHEVARDYKAKNIDWVVIGEENYGEGSSREHAAMEPRHLGCKAVIVKSYARIHEANLKKQGVLALTFANKDDYDIIKEDDKISINVKDFDEQKPFSATITHADGSSDEIQLQHTYSKAQFEWFKAGSALNLIAASNTKNKGKTMDKIQMQNKIVEIDGDEMTRVMWKMVKEELLEPFIGLNTEYYDLGLEHRDETDDQVTIDAANAIKEHGVGVKCATITPDANRVVEYNLKKQYKSPNGTLRGMLDGTVFRTPIIVKNIKPYVNTWKKPITIGRHAYGDVYKNQEMQVGMGKAEIVFTNEDGEEERKTIHTFKGPGIIQGIHNTDASITSFAKACFTYAYDQKIDLWFSTKDTISKTYDTRFREIFQDEYEKNWKEKFAQAGLTYFFTLIDDIVARVIKSEGGYLWACKNYDGDVMSDMVANAFGSLAMMTSVLVSPHGYFEYEAAHGTVQRHYYKHQKGEETSTNSMALIFAWSGALRKRGELDGNDDLVTFADKLEKACIDTIESGVMTGDLYAIATPSDSNKKVNTKEFIAAIKEKLEEGK